MTSRATRRERPRERPQVIACAAALAAAIALLPGIAGAAAAPAPRTFALDHVAVIDVRGGDVIPDRMVVVAGGRILAIAASGEATAPEGAQLLDARGKYLLPGLWDMHVHLHAPAFLSLLLAEGVTGVREMGNDPAVIRDWRERVNDGRLPGPRIVMAGLILDGPEPTWPGISRSIHDAEEARAAVDACRREGSDFIKVYNGLSRESYAAILDEAANLHLPVVGHVPFAITVVEASSDGQRSIEHLMGVLEGSTANPHPGPMGGDRAWFLAHVDTTRADSMFATFARNGTWMVPTLVMKRAFAHARELSVTDDPRFAYIPPHILLRWQPRNDFRLRFRTPASYVASQRELDQDFAFVRVMRRFGVRFLAGTDLGNPYVVPGFSLHDELGLLVQAGLTPLEALRSATLGPAEFLGESDSLGTVETGKVADLVLLDANPLEDIGNVAQISAVCVRGTLLGRATLDGMLDDVKRAAR